METYQGVDKFIYKTDSKGEQYAIINPVYEKLIHNRLYRLADIPEFYWNINWEDYKGDKSLISLRHARKYSDKFIEEKLKNVSLYLFSPIKSTQKTAVACNICKEVITKHHLKVKFVSAAKLIDNLMKTQGFSSNRHSEEFVESLLFCDLICIDDLWNSLTSLAWSKQESNAQIIAAWDSFLRPVLTSKTRIVMTSNIPVDMIKDKYNEYLWELVDRNFIQLDFNDCIKEERKESFEDILEEL